MSNRRLAVVNPLLHPPAPLKTNDSDKPLEKPSEFFTNSVENVSGTKDPPPVNLCNPYIPELCGNNNHIGNPLSLDITKRFTCVAVSTSRENTPDNGVDARVKNRRASCEPLSTPILPTMFTINASTPTVMSRRVHTGDQNNPSEAGRDSIQSMSNCHTLMADGTNRSPASVRHGLPTPNYAVQMKNTVSFDLTRSRLARATHDFHDPSNPSALSFHKGDRITVLCEHSTSKPNRQLAYRGFLTTRGPQSIGLVPGWTIEFLTTNNPLSLCNPDKRKIKVDFAVQTDFPTNDYDDEEYFSETEDDESGSSEVEPNNTDRKSTKSPNMSLSTARTNSMHFMSSSVELKPPRGPGSPQHSTTTTTMLGVQYNTSKSPSAVVNPDQSCDRGVMSSANVTPATIITPPWDATKRHSAASLDSGRDSTYAGSSEGSGGAQTTNPPVNGMLRSPQPLFDHGSLYLNTSSGKNDSEQRVLMNSSYPGTVYTRNKTLIASRTPLAGVTSSPESNETNLSRASTESFSEVSVRSDYPYNCGSLPAPSSAQVAGPLPGFHYPQPHQRPVGVTSNRAYNPESMNGYPSPSSMLPGMDHRTAYPTAFPSHYHHSLTQQKRLSYRPTDFYETGSLRPDSDRDPLAQWLRSVGLSRLEEPLSSAGFDLWTLCRTTPEELNACGITNPADRQSLRVELARLHLPDHIPDQLPAKVYDWLAQLDLAVYWPFLREQGLCTFDKIVKLTWEDLEEVGISKLGHQKKFLLAINRLTRLIGSHSGMMREIPCATNTTRDTGGFHYPLVLSPPSAYASPNCSSTSVASPVELLHDTDSVSSIVAPPSLLSADDTSNPNLCFSISDPIALDELEEHGSLSESPPFPSPPSAFQDPIPQLTEVVSTCQEQQQHQDSPSSSLSPHTQSNANPSIPQVGMTTSSSSTTTASLPPPVPLRRSSITETNEPVAGADTVEPNVNHSSKSSLRLRFPRLGRRVQSILSPHLLPNTTPDLDPTAWTSLTRRSSSPSLFPLQSDRGSLTVEQLTKWSSGQLATPQLCLPSNFQAPSDPELQDMTDIRAMLDALSEHLTSATQL